VRNEGFVALVPYWAVWPFETLVLSRRHVSSLAGLSEKEKDNLADILRRLTIRYDNLFEIAFPYSMDSTNSRQIKGNIPNGTFMRTTFLRCCGLRRCRNSWSATNCWQGHNGHHSGKCGCAIEGRA